MNTEEGPIRASEKRSLEQVPTDDRGQPKAKSPAVPAIPAPPVPQRGLLDVVREARQQAEALNPQMQQRRVEVLETGAGCDEPEPLALPSELDISDEAEVTQYGLDPAEVRAAMRKELSSLIDFKVFVEVSPTEAVGHRVIGTRWVITPKGDGVKARLVCTEVAHGKMEGIFSATPSALATRLCLFLASFQGNEVLVCDISTAFLHASVEGAGESSEPIFVRPPRELQRDGPEGRPFLWRLQKALYGLRRAPALFQAHLRSVLISLGFAPSVGDPCLFTHKETGITLLVHVDDMLLAGLGEAVKTMATRISEKDVPQDCGLHHRSNLDQVPWEGNPQSFPLRRETGLVCAASKRFL